MTIHDYIIVGAGSAGCVLANRLSADPNAKVLLIEAGPRDNSPLISMPRGYLQLHGDARHVWHFPLTPGDADRNWHGSLIGGKVLGGSSAINSMIYTRGQPQDYDEWAASGAMGWGWRDMAPCFEAIERHDLAGAGARSGQGPLHISLPRPGHEFFDRLIAAGVAMGLAYSGAIDQPERPTIGFFPVTIRDGRRVSAATAFLAPAAGRRNLTVATGTTVTRLVFEGQRATGVACALPGGAERFHAGREIILAAGALQSPRLLQISGIGPAEHLHSFGIAVICDSPGVGSNLREHWKFRAQYRLAGYAGHNRHLRGIGLRLSRARYRFWRTGVLATAGAEIGAFLAVRPDAKRPDAELQITPASTSPGAPRSFEAQPGLQCAAIPLRTQSQGTVRLRSADPAAPAAIWGNFLGAEYDRRVMIDTLRFNRLMLNQPMIKPYIAAETFPGPACQSDDEIIAACRQHGTAGSHFAGTCRMGRDPMAVVDERLRVRGVEGLRVADASIMPSLVSGHPNGPVMAMAWRAADLILQNAGR